MDHCKSIVNYDDDDEDEHNAKAPSKDRGKSTHYRTKSPHHKDLPSSSENGRKERKEFSSEKRISRESRRREDHHHSSHRHQSSSHRPSKSHHRDHARSRSRSPYRRRRTRSRSSSRSRKPVYRPHNSTRHDSRYRSRNCHKSKRDRSRSRSRTRSRSKSPNYRLQRHVSKSESPRRKNLEVINKQEMNIEIREQITKAPENVPRLIEVLKIPKPPILNVPMNEPKFPMVHTAPVIPSYYNAKTVNPLKIASQEEKRKLLWGDTKKDKASGSATNVWKNLKFQGERGSQMTEKFRKLMGIKTANDEDATVAEVSSDKNDEKCSETPSTQEELFQNLDMQYSMARMTTHTHRGVGLGFANNNRLL